jgi:hypothetical protein
LIDGRFSREAFESLRSAAERRLLARALADEIRAMVVTIPTADGAVSAILARLRLVGHHLYPLGDGRFAGDASVDAASPTGLELQFRRDAIEVTYSTR